MMHESTHVILSALADKKILLFQLALSHPFFKTAIEKPFAKNQPWPEWLEKLLPAFSSII